MLRLWLLLVLCLNGLSFAFDVQEALPAISSFNEIFRTERTDNFLAEAKDLRDSLISFFEYWQDSPDQEEPLSPRQAQECLGFLIFTVTEEVLILRVNCFAEAIFETFMQDPESMQEFTQDICKTFKPRLYYISPISDALMLSCSLDGSALSKAYLNEVLEYMRYNEITPDTFDKIQFLSFFVGAAYHRYGLGLTEVLEMIPFLPEIFQLIPKNEFYLLWGPVEMLCSQYYYSDEFRDLIVEFVLDTPNLDEVNDQIERFNIKNSWIKIMACVSNDISEEFKNELSEKYPNLMEIHQKSIKRSLVCENIIKSKLEDLTIDSSEAGLKKAYLALEAISKLIPNLINDELSSRIESATYKLFRGVFDKIVINHSSPDANLQYPILISVESCKLLALFNYKGNKCLFNQIGCITVGRALVHYHQNTLLQESLFNRLTPEATAEMLDLLSIVFSGPPKAAMIISIETLYLAVFLHHVKAPKERIIKMGINILPTLDWSDESFFKVVLLMLGSATSEVFTLIVLQRIGRITTHIEKLDVIVFLKSGAKYGFFSETELEFLYRLLQC